MSLGLDFLPESENGRPLILIHGDDRDAVLQLAKAFGRLSRGVLERLAINDLPHIDADECRLIAGQGERDQGAHELGSTRAFEWVESPARWADVAGLVVTLRPPSKSGHQYLAPSPFGGGRGIAVQLSVGERWAV